MPKAWAASPMLLVTETSSPTQVCLGKAKPCTSSPWPEGRGFAAARARKKDAMKFALENKAEEVPAFLKNAARSLRSHLAAIPGP